MKFKFPLQKVLEHRKTLEDVAQRDFQEVFHDLKKMLIRLDEMDALMKQAHIQAYEIQMEGGTQGPALNQINDFIRNHKLMIVDQKNRITQQEDLVEQKRELLQAAAVETKIIDKFKEKKFGEFKKHLEDEDQKEMDEQSILRFKSGEKKKSE
jgi:flagellar FliJ protein